MTDEILAALKRELGFDLRVVREDRRRHSRILRVSAETPGGTLRLIAKQVEPDGEDVDSHRPAAVRVATEFNVLRLVHERFPSNGRFGTIRPVASFPELRTVVMEEAPGSSLNVAFRRFGRGWSARRSRERLMDACHRVGEWLAQFQDLTRSPDAVAPHLERVRSEILDLLSRLVARAIVRFPEELAVRIPRFVDRALEHAEPGSIAVTGATGEISPENMLLDGTRLIILDFGMYGPDTALSDPAMFYYHLARLGHNPIYRPSLTSRLQTSFLEGYGRAGLDRDAVFRVYLLKFKLSRMDAESGRKWESFDAARKLFYRRVWHLEKKDLDRVVAFDEPHR